MATRYIAFLRAINVGGRTVKMGELRSIFETLDFENVATFIASGNVIFETGESNETALERRIEKRLRQSLGYDVATFVRRVAAVDAVAGYSAFDEVGTAGASRYIIFLREPPDDRVSAQLLGMRTTTDDLHVHGREVHWLRRGSLRDSTISGARIEKLLDAPVTIRNINTVVRLSAKYGSTD